MHNGELANPFYHWTKTIKAQTGKRGKTDSEQMELARMEFCGGLYQRSDGTIYLPSENIEAAVALGVSKVARKIGKKNVRAMFFVDGDGDFDFDGKNPTDANKLFEDKNFVLTKMVKVGNARVPRTRPVFRSWSAKFKMLYFEDQINVDILKDAVAAAGRLVGLGDWRPKYGRYIVTKFSEK
jgi:hypothetical protein